jgi:Ni/Fe-hydrogenase subunit HybB-like protein
VSSVASNSGKPLRESALPVLKGGYSYASISDKISDIVLTRPTHWGWVVGFTLCSALTVLLVGAMSYLFYKGVGIWGVNVPVAWAFAITNFVWWVGIGHAGTFISAFLLLLRQKWRTSINRFAEAMTIFAVAMAGLMPILHLGRPWFFYWLFPYPDIMNVWPQWRSPLVWDIFAIGTYIIVSILFWYMGLIPDLATLRDRAGSRARQIVYGLGALGWRGEARQWRRFDTAYLLMAGLATPLVISVHSVVSLDFSIAQLPGWHSTIFPPYFVVGAIYSGLAMVLVLLLPLRRAFGLEDIVTERHLDAIAKLMLAMGLMLAYSYVMETFISWYSGSAVERYTYLHSRPFGPYAVAYWVMTVINVVAPQVFWWRRVRTNTTLLFVAALAILCGMWMERFIIIVTSLNRDFLTSSWHIYVPTWVDWSLLAGSLGLFGVLFLLFARFVPSVALSEVKALRIELSAADGAGAGAHG